MKLSLAHGTFDLLHPGHRHHLKKAAEYGDRFVVSVTSDRWVCKGPGRPIFPERERMAIIADLRFVHNVILSDEENAVDVIRRLRPAFFCKGPDYLNGDKTGNLEKERQAVEAHGGRMVFIPNDLIYSSTEILTGALLQKRIKECQSYS